MNSAGILYFYINGNINENDELFLNVINNYHQLPDSFYNRINSQIKNNNNYIDIFGVIGTPSKIQDIKTILKSELKNNYNLILKNIHINKNNNFFDESGNIFFKIIQEFFCEQPTHYPQELEYRNNEWTLYALWNGQKDEEYIAEKLINLWLTKETPSICGKQIMIRSFFMKDFIDRKVITCLPNCNNDNWNIIFEGGNNLSLDLNETFNKKIPSSKEIGFFTTSEIDNILMNPVYAFKKFYYPNDLCMEWHKVFLYTCAISNIKWNLDNLHTYYQKFLNFLEENICDTLESSPIVSKEQYYKVILEKINNIKNFLKGEDEIVISKDLLKTLNTRYVYLPYIQNIITIKKPSNLFSKHKLNKLIKKASNTTDTYQKGILWEDVAEYFIKNINDWKITGRRIKAGYQEIDLSIVNISLNDELWQLGSYILVECKNWKKHVDLAQIRNIAYISNMKGNKTALLFTNSELTENAKKEILRLASNNIYILCITKKDLLNLDNNLDCLNLILKKFKKLQNETLNNLAI